MFETEVSFFCPRTFEDAERGLAGLGADRASMVPGYSSDRDFCPLTGVADVVAVAVVVVVVGIAVDACDRSDEDPEALVWVKRGRLGTGL